ARSQRPGSAQAQEIACTAGANGLNAFVSALHHDIIMVHVTRDDTLGPVLTTVIGSCIIAILGTIALSPCIWCVGELFERRHAAREAERLAAGEEKLRGGRKRRPGRCARMAASIPFCSLPSACALPRCWCCASGAPAGVALKVREVARQSLADADESKYWRRVFLPAGSSHAALQAAIIAKLRQGEDGAAWAVTSMVQPAHGLLMETDDDVAALKGGEEVEVTLRKSEGKKID
ncbi:unnamed protein product, partial [Symbiodinium sp. KB8]